MSLGTCFDLLSQIVEQYESEGGSVRAVEVTTDDNQAVRAMITVSAAVPGSDTGREPTLVAESASVNDEGGVEVSFSASHLIDVMERSEASVNAEVRGASSTDDGELVLTVEVVIGAPSDASEVTTADDADTDEALLAAGEGSDGDEKPTENGVEAFDGGDETDGDRPETAGCAGGEPTPSSSVTEGLAAVRDESVPPYEDIDYLEQLYERCETFTEMTRLIEMDVSSETVRRYMIEAGVHTPTSYDTAPQTREPESEEPRLEKPDAGEPSGRKPDTDSSTAHGADADSSETDPDERRESEDDSPSEPTPEPSPEPSPDTVGAEKLVTDGIGLPNRVQIPDVVDAVVTSVTLYGFARRLDLEQEDARELLRQLNLLDFVPRRLPGGKQELSHDDVAERIRRSTGSA
ncbi:hypothetical protein C474_07122 [Halogeometricum pallidum JCM 14848]|uniref:Uncharacterized protein n=1 Tax=Halogeometricum pallidum JCM 14848 TaxID=1227487 RepID=M0DCX3_HALPD|nr:hypothetical protein [Halogeometricum pallidum]ELZ32572.1 hypothetical protein C474_07122 [Halogeometricum pallidum JCM 14848]